MIIPCPFCGPRDLSEFSYCGDADNLAARPDPASEDQAAWNAYVYDRANPAGEHAEIWQHAGGCRRHLRVVRNTVTHEISGVTMLGPQG
ncbi:MAG: sarcosine oxidase subunit delta [Roseitalea porphyridii]|jgi:heterotetrameric sarcosine oxidase delta subunit|uniref:sarcosine oxidase subunit delta n=1 Tax=Roseitalea porphyridii TaxID=1852022 RepID=UPI0032F0514A